jgi:hypothetical protein
MRRGRSTSFCARRASSSRRKGRSRLPYRIVNWAKHFENNRTRDMKEMQWVPIKNRMGTGYTELMLADDTGSFFGAWVALVEVASTCTPRGTLLRGNCGLTAGKLAAICRFRPDVMDAAIAKLLEMGWLEEIQESAGKPQADCGQTAGSLRPHKKEGKEGKEGKEAAAPPLRPPASPEWFETSATPPRPTLAPLTAEEFAGPDLDSIAQQTARELTKAHWYPSDAALSRGFLATELATAVNPMPLVKSIVDSHRLWREQVEEARQSGSLPRTIANKALQWWLKDRYFEQKPSFGASRIEQAAAKPGVSRTIARLLASGEGNSGNH